MTITITINYQLPFLNSRYIFLNKNVQIKRFNIKFDTSFQHKSLADIFSEAENQLRKRRSQKSFYHIMEKAHAHKTRT